GSSSAKNVAASITPAAPLIMPTSARRDGWRMQKTASAPKLVPRPASRLAITPYQKISASPGRSVAAWNNAFSLVSRPASLQLEITSRFRLVQHLGDLDLHLAITVWPVDHVALPEAQDGGAHR